MSRGIITIAVGKPVYFRMATALACSFERWNRDNDIEFAVVTDLSLPLPGSLRKTRRLQVEPGQIPVGFEAKLHMDKLSPFSSTLFVDSDCICFDDLSEVFERFSGRSVSTVGRSSASGEWCGDIAKRCMEFNLASIPVFVGCLYYFETGPRSAAVFDRARALVPDYDRLELSRLRGKPNEEPLLSIAMAEHGQQPIDDDGSTKVDAMHCQSIDCDVVSGKRKVYSMFFGEVAPRIIHFNDAFAERTPYTTDVLALNLIYRYYLPAICARIGAVVFDRMPRVAVRTLKNLMRSPYHRLFGVRAVVSADR